MSLLKEFDALMVHLNAEGGDQVCGFRESLQVLTECAEDDANWRNALEAFGVDNWCGYDRALKESGYWADKMENRHE